MTSAEPMRVLVAGAGVAGLETVLALQALAGDRTAIELLAPDRHFTYRPLAVAEPFAPGSVQRFPIAAIAADRAVPLVRDAVAQVHADDRVVETQDGSRLEYDALVLALGSRPTEAVPGALTFRGPQDVGRVGDVVAALRAGTIRRVAFVVPGGTTWALPLYELALQAATAVRGAGAAAELSLVTPEPTPLAAFGEEAGAAVTTLLEERGITLRTGAIADDFDEGRLWMGLEGSFAVDRVIALARLVGPRPRGVPCDPLGFIPVDEYTRVLELDAVHAVGDAAAARRQAGRARRPAGRRGRLRAGRRRRRARHPQALRPGAARATAHRRREPVPAAGARRPDGGVQRDPVVAPGEDRRAPPRPVSGRPPRARPARRAGLRDPRPGPGVTLRR